MKRHSKMSLQQKSELKTLTACQRCGDKTTVSEKKLVVLYGNRDSKHGDAFWVCNDCYEMVIYCLSQESTVSVNNRYE